MTAQLDIERVLDDFLGDGTDELSDRVLEAALRDTEHIRQRRAHGVPRRFSDMPTPLRLLAAAAILATALGGAFLLGGSLRNDAQLTPTPSPDVQPTVAPPEGGILPPGRHRTTVFQPGLTFTVPEGWKLTKDETDFVRLCPASLCSGGQVDVQRYPAGTAPLAIDNTNHLVPGVGTGLLDVMTYIAERPDVDVIQPPTAWQVDGADGYWMEIANSGDTELGFIREGMNLYPGGHNRFAHIQLQDGTLVTIVIFTFKDTEAYLGEATPIIESFDFDLPTQPPSPN